MPLWLNGNGPNWHSIQRLPAPPEYVAESVEHAKEMAASMRPGATQRTTTTLETLEAMRMMNGSILKPSASASVLNRREREADASAVAEQQRRKAKQESKMTTHSLPQLKVVHHSPEDLARRRARAQLKERVRVLKALDSQVQRQLSQSKLDDSVAKQLLNGCNIESQATLELLRSVPPPPLPPPPPPPPPPPLPRPTHKPLRPRPVFDHNRFYNDHTDASDGQRVVMWERHGERHLTTATLQPPAARPACTHEAARPKSAAQMRPPSAKSGAPQVPLSYMRSYSSLATWAAFRYAEE